MSDRLKNPVECAGCGIATRKPSIAGIFTRYTMPDKAGCGGSYCGRRELDCLLGAGFMDACDLIAVKICKEAKDE